MAEPTVPGTPSPEQMKKAQAAMAQLISNADPMKRLQPRIELVKMLLENFQLAHDVCVENCRAQISIDGIVVQADQVDQVACDHRNAARKAYLEAIDEYRIAMREALGAS